MRAVRIHSCQSLPQIADTPDLLSRVLSDYEREFNILVFCEGWLLVQIIIPVLIY